MKLTKQKLIEMIKGELKELTGTQSAYGKKVGYKTPERRALQKKMTKKKAKQPPKYITLTRSKTDTTRWIHPKSGITTPVTKDAPQPKKGWSYRQSTVTPGKADTTKWTSPYEPGEKKGTFKTTTLGKGEKQPEAGWSRTQTARPGGYIHPYSGKEAPIPKGTKVNDFYGWEEVPQDSEQKTKYFQGTRADYKGAPAVKKGWTRSATKAAGPELTTYGHGSEDDYTKAKKAAGPGTDKQFSALKKTTNPLGPSTTTYATKYGHGSVSDYTTAQQTTSGADQWSSGDTTNPSSEEEYQGLNPDYEDWYQGQSGEYSYEDMEQDDANYSDYSMPDDPPAGGGGFGGTTGGGGGKGRGKGKGKGKKGKKKKKREESLNRILGKNFINELNKFGKTLKKEKK